MIDYLSEIELDRAVLFILHQHKGKNNAIARWNLVERVFGSSAVILPLRTNDNIWDRQVRDCIERWRLNGQHLCNVGNGAGYYVANTREEYEEFKRFYLSAVYRKLKIAEAMDDAADDRWGVVPRAVSPLQVSLFGMLEAR